MGNDYQTLSADNKRFEPPIEIACVHVALRKQWMFEFWCAATLLEVTICNIRAKLM